MSSINEIFPHATVKQVAFEIKYSNLFYIENKIGDIQSKIMEEFPESSLFYRRQLMFVDVGPEGKFESVPQSNEPGKKVWNFKSPKKYELSITSDSLAISSEFHKTYNMEGAPKFRDIIEYVLKNFFSIIQIPVIKRIGFRYIDECPIFQKDNATFSKYYNTAFPLKKFSIEDAEEMVYVAVVKKGEFNLRYTENFKYDKEYKLIMDFDGYAKDIKSGECLSVTDKLHGLILEEYNNSITDAFKEYMRTGKVGSK